MAMTLSSSTRSGHSVLSVQGEIDTQTAPALRAALDELLAAGQSRIVIDLADVAFLDSSALGTFVGANNELGADGTLVIACANPRLTRLFRLTRLDEVLRIVASVDVAVGRAPHADPAL